MNKKRFFLEPPEVKDYLVKGDRFTKWSEVSENLNKAASTSKEMSFRYLYNSNLFTDLFLFSSTNLNSKVIFLVVFKDSTKTVPVTMKMDPKGFYVYWINQSKVMYF